MLDQPCPTCGHMLDINEQICPACGVPRRRPRRRRGIANPLTLFIIPVMALLGGLFGISVALTWSMNAMQSEMNLYAPCGLLGGLVGGGLGWLIYQRMRTRR